MDKSSYEIIEEAKVQDLKKAINLIRTHGIKLEKGGYLVGRLTPEAQQALFGKEASLTCSKCGGTEIKTRWFQGLNRPTDSNPLTQIVIPNPGSCSRLNETEHLHRTCSCGWQWCDATLDAEGSRETESGE